MAASSAEGDQVRISTGLFQPIAAEDVAAMVADVALAKPANYRDISVASAIRYVVEELSRDERPRAVVCTPTGLLFINEIEALYDQPEFPKAA
jgi:uncharacterized protein YbjT (DUF2867 family)